MTNCNFKLLDFLLLFLNFSIDSNLIFDHKNEVWVQHNIILQTNIS